VRRLGFQGPCDSCAKKSQGHRGLPASGRPGPFTSERTFGLAFEGECVSPVPSAAWPLVDIPEVVEHAVSGILVPFGDLAAMRGRLEEIDWQFRPAAGELGPRRQRHARKFFSADLIVPR